VATTEEILGMNYELNKILKQRYDLDCEKYDKIREIEKEYGVLINSLCEISSAMRQELLKYNPNFIKKSEFDLKIIGTYIADLISEIEDKNYYYYTAQYFGRFHKSDQYGETLTTEQSSFHLIGLEPTGVYEEDCPVDKRYSFLNNDNIIKLKKSVKTHLYQSYIKFYDYNQDDVIEKTVDTGRFDYVYDFINKLIDYKLDNNIDTISNDDIENIYDEFINEYKYKNIKILKPKKGVQNGKKDS